MYFGKRFLLCALTALLLILPASGCKQAELAQPASPEAALQARGQVEAQRYLNTHYGLYWFKPAGMNPLQPGESDHFLFGWQDKSGRVLARLWLLPETGADLKALAAREAKARKWSLGQARAISMQGRPALDATYQAGERAGRLRLLQSDKWVLFMAAEAPAAWAGKHPARLVAVLERLRLIPPGDVLHVVKRASETLNMVSLWYTGMAANWTRIMKYNHLRDQHLSANQEILIPRDLVWRLDPMPPWATRLVRRSSRGKAPSKPQGGTPELELLPTGPK